MTKLSWLLLIALAALAVVVGCGGGGGGGGTTPTVDTPVTFRIAWAERSRDIMGPASARSAKLTLTGADPAGGDFVAIATRNENPAAYTHTYTTTKKCRPGSWPLKIQFFANGSATGDVVANGNANVTLQPDGSGIGDITTDPVISSLVVNPGQSVEIGVVEQLTFTAYNSQHAIVVVSPGSGHWAQTSGQTNMALTEDGLANGLLPGVSNVTVSLDGLTSDPESVTVVAMGDRVVYESDFETAVGSEWSKRNRSVTPLGARRFLGEFSNDNVTLTLTNLPQHAKLRITFDLFVIKSWDGNGPTAGPDFWGLKVGSDSVIETTFLGSVEHPNPYQSYPGPFQTDNIGLTGSTEFQTLGYYWFQYALDSVYPMTYTVNHTGDEATITFYGRNLEGLDNESWGIDNLKVETVLAED